MPCGTGGGRWGGGLPNPGIAAEPLKRVQTHSFGCMQLPPFRLDVERVGVLEELHTRCLILGRYAAGHVRVGPCVP